MKTVKVHYFVLLAVLFSFAIILSSSGEIKPGSTTVPTTISTNETPTATTVNKMTSVTSPTVSGPFQPSLNAILVDPDAQSKDHAAMVHVTLSGISLTEPGGQASPGQGHIHYQLDNHPSVATTATDLSFQNLSSGPHKIVISLAGNNHALLGPSQTVSFQIP
jgi:hypothetical protein